MKRESKFNVKKDKTDRTFDGIVFDSAAEMKYYRDVILPQIEAGDIVGCERQKRYVLQDKFKREGKTILPIEYKADFVVQRKDGTEKVIDIKGCPDPISKMKRKMFWFKYPVVDYVWLGHSKELGGWVAYEAIDENRKQKRKNKKENKE
jgi:hypothetical protein